MATLDAGAPAAGPAGRLLSAASAERGAAASVPAIAAHCKGRGRRSGCGISLLSDQRIFFTAAQEWSARACAGAQSPPQRAACYQVLGGESRKSQSCRNHNNESRSAAAHPFAAPERAPRAPTHPPPPGACARRVATRARRGSPETEGRKVLFAPRSVNRAPLVLPPRAPGAPTLWPLPHGRARPETRQQRRCTLSTESPESFSRRRSCMRPPLAPPRVADGGHTRKPHASVSARLSAARRRRCRANKKLREKTRARRRVA